jgi:hypothetical protein
MKRERTPIPEPVAQQQRQCWPNRRGAGTYEFVSMRLLLFLVVPLFAQTPCAEMARLRLLYVPTTARRGDHRLIIPFIFADPALSPCLWPQTTGSLVVPKETP